MSQFSKIKSFLGGEGRLGVDAVSPGVKASPSMLGPISVGSISPLSSPITAATMGAADAASTQKPSFLQRAMKGDLTNKEMLGLSAASSAVGLGAGLYDINQEFKREMGLLGEKTASEQRMLESRATAQAEQSAKDFELRKEIGAKQHALALDMQNQKFEAAMDMIAEQTGIAKDQLMNDVQFSQTVSNINQLDTLLNLAKQQSMQPYDENTQQFFS